jgi:uncharacterized iron-regulated protein
MPRPSHPRNVRRHAARLALWACTAGCAALLAAGCAGMPGSAPQQPRAASLPDRLQALLPADVLLLGEQHDAPDHQRLQREAVQWLAARGELAAVVMEMAEAGHSTAGLARNATPEAARAALQWNDAAWPWAAYGPVVMAAVAAGVPVLGGNLPRSELRAAMGHAAWDGHLPPAALQRQHAALRDGHCGLLPPSQIAPMARAQIARDASLARTARQALRPGQTVLLVAGGGHVLRTLGVPTHWPAEIRSKVVLAQAGQALAAIKSDVLKGDVDAVLETPAIEAQDHCAALRKHWGEGRKGQRPAGG